MQLWSGISGRISNTSFNTNFLIDSSQIIHVSTEDSVGLEDNDGEGLSDISNSKNWSLQTLLYSIARGELAGDGSHY